MAKREQTSVDEDEVRGIMMRSVPVFDAGAPVAGAPAPAPVPASASPSAAAVVETPVPAPKVTASPSQAPKSNKPDEQQEPPHSPPLPSESHKPPTKRKKREEEPEGSYAGKFLVNDHNKNRVSANISRKLFDRIKKYLPVIARDVSMTSYLNNIISEHIEAHWDEIRELIAQNVENIYDHDD